MNPLCLIAALLASIAAITLAVTQFKPNWNGIRWGAAKLAKMDADKTERNIKIINYVLGAAGLFLLCGCVARRKFCN